MKIIVSSKLLAEKLQEAFNIDAHCIQYFAGDGTIQFGTTKYQSDVLLNCERQYLSNSETLNFNNLGMAKLLFFLKKIREQPITLTLEQETIRVEHSVIDFI